MLYRIITVRGDYMEDKGKYRRVELRLYPEEYAYIQAAAKKEGLKVATFCRVAALDRAKKKSYPYSLERRKGEK